MLSYVQIILISESSGLALAVRLFFQTYFNILKNYLFRCNFQHIFRSKSGCKDKPYSLFLPNFLITFFSKKLHQIFSAE